MKTIGREPDSGAGTQRLRRLQWIAWSTTLLPLLVFGALTWQTARVNSQLNETIRTRDENRAALVPLKDEQARLEQTKAELTRDIEALSNNVAHYRALADLRLQFYRETDRAIVERALDKLGFKLDAQLGNSVQTKLITGPPNSIAFGKRVSSEDLEAVVDALLRAGLPLRRIARAVVAVDEPDARLIQVFPSVDAERECGRLSIEQVRQKVFCGPKTP